MRVRSGVLAGFGLGALFSCSSSPPRGSNSHDLAVEAVHSALDNGAFEAMMDQAIQSAYAVAKARVEGTGEPLTTERSRQLETALHKVMLEVYPRSAWEEALLPLYLDGMDREELQQVVDFQRSPLGSKLMVVHARLITGGADLGSRLMKSREAELSKRLSEELGSWNRTP